jgi:hypothetical protein
VNRPDLLLDTGPFVVFVVASVDPGLLGSSQHLKEYTPEDALLIESFGGQFRSLWLTPHVVTEAAHFITKIAAKHGKRFKVRLAEILNAVNERPVSSGIAAARIEFAWLDLADCSLLEAAAPRDTLLSTDALLVARRLELGFPAVNFNHLREQAGLL